MIFEGRIDGTYRRSIEDALGTIIENGNDNHRRVAELILESRMRIRVLPVRRVKASGQTGLIDAGDTNDKIENQRISLREAFDEIQITIAEETIETGGQRGCEGTLVHEGRHAFDFAQTIESFSNADLNPLSVYDPTLYELEWEAHITSGEYMLRIARGEYIEEGMQLLILGKDIERGCFLNEEGIRTRLSDSYGLTFDNNPGPRASEILGLRQK